MKIAKVLSAQNDCLDGQIIQVEVDISRGLHAFSIVGMADKAVAEAKDRIASAIKHSGYKSPKSRNEKVVISLAPAQLPKEGTGFDLAMAIGYLIATQDLRPSIEASALAEKMLFIGELALDGILREGRGILSIAKSARDLGVTHLFVPKENAGEACLVPGISIYGAVTLREIILHIEGKKLLLPTKPEAKMRTTAKDTMVGREKGGKESGTEVLFHRIEGQAAAKRALLIALAGRHSIALVGPPGTGKTVLARSAHSIIPDLTEPEQVEVLSIYSSAHTLAHPSARPPFRAPHHSASYAAIIGGGGKQPIGEITLAHKGILFLDEFPEFDRRVIEALRQPMEEGAVRIARADKHRELPADCITILAMNPCPCGYRNSIKRACTCSQTMLRRYAEKISGPIIDRIDMWVRVEQPNHSFAHIQKKMAASGNGGSDNSGRNGSCVESSVDSDSLETIKKRLFEIRTKQRGRSTDSGGADVYLGATDGAMILLAKQADAHNISTRGFHRSLRVARTIADLEQSAKVDEKHILEALQYRQVPL